MTQDAGWREDAREHLKGARLFVQDSLDNTPDRATIGNLMGARDEIDAATRLLASASPPPSVGREELREKIARLIDPEAWENVEGHRQAIDGLSGPGPLANLCAELIRPHEDAIRESTEAALEKADAILALLPPSGEGEGNQGLSSSQGGGVIGSALEVVGISDEEDGGAVALLLNLPDGQQVWSGEVSRDLFEEQAAEDREALGDDGGDSFITHAGPNGTRILARAVDRWAAMDLAHAYAEWLNGLRSSAEQVPGESSRDDLKPEQPPPPQDQDLDGGGG